MGPKWAQHAAPVHIRGHRGALAVMVDSVFSFVVAENSSASVAGSGCDVDFVGVIRKMLLARHARHTI